MKQRTSYTQLAIGALLLLGIAACKYKVTDLLPAPKASFTVTPISGQTNKYLLTSTSTGSFRYDWDRGTGSYQTNRNPSDTVYFPDAGTYTIRLQVFGQGGVDSTRQNIVVAADDPAALTPIKIITGNSTKTWILEQPAGGALWVGDTGGSQWWANSSGDVNAPDRTCLFNDEYKFSMNGNFVFDDRGDIRVDDENGQPWPAAMGPAIACYATSSIPAAYQAWGSGNFTYQIISGTPNKLKVIGNGAHMGLYKAGETGTTDHPEPFQTYNIIELTPTRMVLQKMYGWGQWKFTFKPKP